MGNVRASLECDRTEQLLKRMHKCNCGVTFRTREESTQVLCERLEQLSLENKGKSLEARLIKRILLAVQKEISQAGGENDESDIRNGCATKQ